MRDFTAGSTSPRLALIWSAVWSSTEAERRVAKLRRQLVGVASLGQVSGRWAWVEYLIAQGDGSTGHAMLDAWRAGGGWFV